MKYTDYVMLIVEYSNMKHEYLTVKNSGKYELRKERRLKVKMQKIFDQLCEEASKVFPHGKSVAQ